KRVARSLDKQFFSVHVYGLGSFSDGRSRFGWPVATMNCVRVSHLFNVEAKMCRYPGVANHIRQDRCEDQLRTLKGKDDVPVTLGNRMQSPQGSYRDRHTLASVFIEQPFPNQLQADRGFRLRRYSPCPLAVRPERSEAKSKALCCWTLRLRRYRGYAQRERIGEDACTICKHASEPCY